LDWTLVGSCYLTVIGGGFSVFSVRFSVESIHPSIVQRLHLKQNARLLNLDRPNPKPKKLKTENRKPKTENAVSSTPLLQ